MHLRLCFVYVLRRLLLVPVLVLSGLREPPASPLFPYTTLFRSTPRADPDCGPAGRPPPASRSRPRVSPRRRSEEHTSELQSLRHLVCRLLLEKKNINRIVTALRNGRSA